MKILYPGTFDPLTNGHIDLIERAEKIFGNLVVAVLENTSKTPTFNLQRRILQIKNSLSHLPNIEVISYTGLTVNCANDLKANLILRGLRAMSDFEYELQIAHTNKSLNNEIASDFAEEYGLQENGELSSTSMNELVDWAEEESMQRKIEQVSVIKKV